MNGGRFLVDRKVQPTTLALGMTVLHLGFHHPSKDFRLKSSVDQDENSFVNVQYRIYIADI